MKKNGAAEPLERSAASGRREPLGVARVLPEQAAEILVAAAAVARSLEEGSLARRRAIEDAVVAVKNRWPSFFRTD